MASPSTRHSARTCRWLSFFVTPDGQKEQSVSEQFIASLSGHNCSDKRCVDCNKRRGASQFGNVLCYDLRLAGRAFYCELGNMDAKRDWGFAKEYVEGMWRMLQADKPDTYVLATNRTETVRDFVTMAFKAVDVTLDWNGSGDNEVAHCTASDKQLVRVSTKFYRPAEVELLIGDPAKAKREKPRC